MASCVAGASRRTVSDGATLGCFWHPTFYELCGTTGYGPETGLPREAFFSSKVKSGTLLDGLLYVAGVLLSLALQYGTPATALAKSINRLEDGSAVSPVGVLIDAIVKEVEAATSNQPNSKGATDADVQAEEGQAKEGAWELFTG